MFYLFSFGCVQMQDAYWPGWGEEQHLADHDHGGCTSEGVCCCSFRLIPFISLWLHVDRVMVFGSQALWGAWDGRWVRERVQVRLQLHLRPLQLQVTSFSGLEEGRRERDGAWVLVLVSVVLPSLCLESESYYCYKIRWYGWLMYEKEHLSLFLVLDCSCGCMTLCSKIITMWMQSLWFRVQLVHLQLFFFL